MEKAKASPGNQYVPKVDRSHADTGPTALSDLCVRKARSSRWQQLAAVPEEQFEP